MNKADSDRIHELCSLIAVEQDRQKFLQLCEELNRILGVKRERLENNKLSDEMTDLFSCLCPVPRAFFVRN